MQNTSNGIRVVGRIYETYDYDTFRFEVVNRNIDENQVNRLKKILKENGSFISPIVVAKDRTIIDGQHRYYALKELGLPVRFILGEETGDLQQDIIKTNNMRKNWSFTDYLEAYAQMNENYRQALMIVEEFKDIASPSTLVKFIGANGTGDSSVFREGSLELMLGTNYLDTKVDELNELAHYHHSINYGKRFTNKYIQIIKEMMKSPAFSWARMRQKLTNKVLNNELLLAVNSAVGRGTKKYDEKALMDVIDYYNDGITVQKNRIKYNNTQDGFTIVTDY